jgi:ERF superfamily protein
MRMGSESKVTTALARLEPQALIQSAVEKGAGIETLERLVALAKEVRAEQAKEAFHDAMSEFKRTCPEIIKSKRADIYSRRTNKSYGYSYAPLERITAVIDPVLAGLGLSYRWRHRGEAGVMYIACVVSHRLGHSEDSGEIPVPVVLASDGEGASAAQRVGIAITYAKRYALLGVLGLSPEEDQDGANGDDEKAGESGTQAPPKTTAPTSPTEPENYTFTFGKHKGKKLADVETGYLNWLIERNRETLSDSAKSTKDKKYAAEDMDRWGREIARREMTPDPNEPPMPEEEPPY